MKIQITITDDAGKKTTRKFENVHTSNFKEFRTRIEARDENNKVQRVRYLESRCLLQFYGKASR